MDCRSKLVAKIEKIQTLLDEVREEVARTWIEFEKSHPDNTDTPYYKCWESKMQNHISKAINKVFEPKKKLKETV